MKKMLVVSIFLLFLAMLYADDVFIKRGNAQILSNGANSSVKVYDFDGITISFLYDRKGGVYFLDFSILRKTVDTELNSISFDASQDSASSNTDNKGIKFSYSDKDIKQATTLGSGGDIVVKKRVNKDGYLNDYIMRLPNISLDTFIYLKQLNIVYDVGVSENKEIDLDADTIRILQDLGIVMACLGLR